MNMRHISTSIYGLLALKDSVLKNILFCVEDENGKHPTLEEFKKYLYEEKAKGHLLLPSPECDNFDPVKGCLGHNDKIKGVCSDDRCVCVARMSGEMQGRK